MPSKSKKRKVSQVSDEEYAKLLDKGHWTGWCEIESEPAYFNVMLRELGVEGLKIQEIFTIDESMLEFLPKPVHALIFLFQYRGNPLRQTEDSCPGHVWFANQIPEHACASVALLNIVNNVPDASLGTQLQSFKDSTTDMNPMERGNAIDSFAFLQATHNSFARQLDILNSNMSQKIKHEKRIARTKDEERRTARQTKAAQKAAEKAADESIKSTATSVRRSARASKPRKDLANASAAIDEGADEAGFHFIAYMPINDRLWRLDGMDSFPTDLGTYDHLTHWTDLAASAIQQQMSEYTDGELSFSLMAVVHDSFRNASLELSQLVEADQTADDGHLGWRDSPKPDEGTTETAPNADVLVPGFATEEPQPEALATGTPKLPPGYPDTLTEDDAAVAEGVVRSDRIAQLRSIIADCKEQRAEDERKASLRRFDYTAFFAEWVDALVDIDVLETLKGQVNAGL